MRRALIAAMTPDGVIGRGNALPWHLPFDLRRFKRMTTGHGLVMGRRTYESIGRPLPGRRIIVLTRQPDFTAAGVEIAHSLDEAYARLAADQEVFVAGGADVYAQALGSADRMYLTLLEECFAGDRHFPSYRAEDWTLVSETLHPPGADVALAHRFVVLDRREAASARTAGEAGS